MAERRFNYLVFVPVIVVALIFGAFGYKAVWDQQEQEAGRDPNALPSAIVGGIAPAVTLTPLPGKVPFTSEDLKKPGIKLVNFWASWCPPCRAEHPNLMALKAEGMTIYGINYKDKPEDALGFLAEMGDPFTALAADAAGRNGINWGVIAMPETFIIDGEGRVVFRYPGPITQRVIESTLRPALEAARATQ